MKAIVTVKLPRNPEHDPQSKVFGECPVGGLFCSDVTGQHHSIIIEGTGFADITRKAKEKYNHITRYEIIEP